MCGGHPDLPRGQGVRCVGWRSDDGEWVHCSREDLGGAARFHPGSATYSHRARGRCPCGEVHAEGDLPPASAPRSAARGPRAEVRQIGEAAGARIVATYDYRNRRGELLYQVVRKEPKTFLQRRPCACGGDRSRRCAAGCREGWLWNMQGQPTTLYRIPELLPGIAAGDTVWIAEGEKDVDALFAAGAVATCNSGGAGKWRDELSAPFRGMAGDRVVIVQDKDEPDPKTGKRAGHEHARAVLASLSDVVPPHVSLVIVEAAVGKDAADHLAAGRGLEEFVQVWPPPPCLLEDDPAQFKRLMLRQALEAPPSVLERVAVAEHQAERQPLFPCGVVGGGDLLRHFQGVVAVAGAPSSGKSYFAISTAVDACLAGWDVFYFSCEMHEDLILGRAARAVVSHGAGLGRFLEGWERQEMVSALRAPVALPERFHHVNVGIGVKLPDVLGYLEKHLSDRPTLSVVDSVSSLVDNMAGDPRSGDAFGMQALREVTRWVVGVRRLTHGHLAWMLLSELNKEGRAKGRFLDHRADWAVAMEPDPELGHLKRVRVTKSWWGPTGFAGDYILDWELGRLRRVVQPGRIGG